MSSHAGDRHPVSHGRACPGTSPIGKAQRFSTSGARAKAGETGRGQFAGAPPRMTALDAYCFSVLIALGLRGLALAVVAGAVDVFDLVGLGLAAFGGLRPSLNRQAGRRYGPLPSRHRRRRLRRSGSDPRPAAGAAASSRAHLLRGAGLVRAAAAAPAAAIRASARISRPRAELTRSIRPDFLRGLRQLRRPSSSRSSCPSLVLLSLVLRHRQSPDWSSFCRQPGERSSRGSREAGLNAKWRARTSRTASTSFSSATRTGPGGRPSIPRWRRCRPPPWRLRSDP